MARNDRPRLGKVPVAGILATTAIAAVVAAFVYLIPESTRADTRAEELRRAAEIESGVRIDVGPNILVSKDGNVAHIEPHLAANPRDSKQLLGTAMVDYESGGRIVAYASDDGGYTWMASPIPMDDAGDPQVAFGVTGTAYVAGLGMAPDKRFGLFFARSTDNGKHWSTPLFLSENEDHPQMAVDYTGGRYNGRVYLTSATLKMFRSSSDGETWETRTFLKEGDNYGHNVCNPLVLSDGSLFIPYASWTQGPGRSQDTATWNFVLSSDGGETFSPQQLIRIIRTGNIHQLPERARRQQFPEFAVDTRNGSRKDRIYMVFPNIVDGYARIFMHYSTDRGKTWSKPIAVDPNSPKHSEQFNQMTAVNKDGVVGISWFDTRANSDGSVFDKYFATSIDGGQSFLPAVRVSTVSIHPHVPGNLVVMPSMSRKKDTVYLAFDRGGARLETGGDYMGLTTDTNGAFHLLWPDTRTGAYRLYTSAVRVDTSATRIATRSGPAATRELIGNEFAVLFDPTQYDDSTGELRVPLRIQNLSADPWYGPMTVRFDVNPNAGQRGASDVRDYPQIIGAANGKTGPGAEFDFTSLMGTTTMIPPGASTGQFVLRLKPKTFAGPIGRLTTFVTVGKR
jgi:hypothetical protein